MTRRAVPLTLGFLAGLYVAYAICVSGAVGSAGFLYLILGAAIIGALSIVLKVSFRARVLLFCAAFMCAAAYSSVYTIYRLYPLEALSGETVTVSGRIIDMTYGDRASILVNGEVGGIRTKILVYINNFSGDIGNDVTLTARAEKFTDTPFFNTRSYYLTDGIMLYANGAEVSKISDGSRNVIDLIRSYSCEVSENIRRTVSGDAGQFLSAMVTGDRSSMSDSLNLTLNRSGVGHLASVSGFHVSIVAAAVYIFLRNIRAPRLLRALLCETAIASFVVFSGLRISAIRAAVMLTIAIGADLFRRRTDPLNTICVCALAMTLFSPYLVAYVPFQLSIEGAFGAAVMAPNLIREFSLKSGLTKAFAVSLCACAATAPFLMLSFNELSVSAPIVNLAAVPVCSLALVFGMIYAALGCRPRFLLRLAGAMVSLVLRLCEYVAACRAAYIPLGYRFLPILGIISLAVCAAVYLIYKKRRLTAFCAVFCAAAVILVHGIYVANDSHKIHLTVINRGSGQALVLRKAAECIIIDFDSRSADVYETIAERQGITSPRAAILYRRAEAGYSAYSAISAKPEVIYLPEDSYIFGGSIPNVCIPDGTEISLPWCRIATESGGAHIVTENGEADVRLGTADGEGLKISLLDGVTVINDGEITAYSGDFMKDFEIGVR